MHEVDTHRESLPSLPFPSVCASLIARAGAPLYVITLGHRTRAALMCFKNGALLAKYTGASKECGSFIMLIDITYCNKIINTRTETSGSQSGVWEAS